MGSETFVDVTWRGIDVGRRIRLRAMTTRVGRLDHGTPMPVGTPLDLMTDEGIAIRATVLRVHEQVGGATEVAGMWIAPVEAGDALAWWQARAEPAGEDAPPPEVDSANTEVMPAMTEASLDISGPVGELDGDDEGPIHVGPSEPSSGIRSDDSAVRSDKKKRGSSRRKKR